MTVTTLVLALALQVTQTTPRDAPVRTRAGTGAIRGRVVAADTGAPMRRVVVSLLPTKTDQPVTSRNVVADAEGRFEFTALPPGIYRVRAMPAAYRGQYLSSSHGGRGPNDMGRSIELAAGQQLEGADIAMLRGGAIPGRVTDDFGDPVTRAMVFTSRVMPGSTTPQRIGSSFQTDDQGRFRVYGLEPGDYVVGAEVRGFGGPPVEGETEGFAVTYYPSSLNDREAARVRVTGSADAGDVEIQLVRTRTFRIAGTVMNSKGEVVNNPQIMLVRPNTGGFNAAGAMSSMQNGKFTIRDVVPGEYRLVVRPMQMGPQPEQTTAKGPRPEYATVPVSVASDIDDLVVMTQPGVSITGRVAFAEGTAPTLPSMRISTMPAERNMTFGPSPGATSAPDGTFTLNDLFGPQLVRGGVTGAGAGTAPAYTLKAVMLGGTDITDTPVEFKADHNRHLELVFTSRASTVEGMVTDDSGAPANDVMIVMIPEDKSAWKITSPRFRMSSLQKEGHFSVPRMLAGRYHAIAVPREGFFLTPDTGPEVFEQMVKDSTLVTVGEDEKRTVDLRVVRPAR